MNTVRIDLFSDIACPFCYIAEKRLERVLEAHSGVDIDWFWHPFQLQPDLPERGIPWDEFSVKKFGGLEARRAAFAHVVRTATSEGITFDFERMPVAPNTQNAHRLMLLASSQKRGPAMAKTLYHAYFSEAKDITNPAELERLASEIGLDSSLVKTMLASDDFKREVHLSQLEAGQLGISGVPFYIFNQKYAVSGAQPDAIFEQALSHALET
jgi:predicted DsbA family dithiol-disulfide isomerase